MFRKAALAKLASPEQLDSLMQVTTPKGWLALTACVVLIVAALVWGLLGRTAEQVNGAGILLKQGGIFGIESRGGGMISEVRVNVGDQVKAGDVVVRVTQSEAAETIRQTKAQLDELRTNRDRSLTLVMRNRDAELRSLEDERRRLDSATAALRKQVAFLEERLAAQREALRQGLITGDQVQATAQELEGARGNLISNQGQVASTAAREATVSNQAEQSSFSLDQEIRRTERTLELTELRFKEGTEVVSPYSGRVVSRTVDPGQEVQPGQAVLYIELSGEPLEVVAYVPLQGARLRPGVTTQMSPEGIAWEEYGYMLGEVVSVTQAPANPEAMNRLLHNQTLIQQFTASGSVYEVRIRPRTDPSTPSGFAWTSREGPPLKIGSGTLLRVQIPVQVRRPIELVVPVVRKWLGI